MKGNNIMVEIDYGQSIEEAIAQIEEDAGTTIEELGITVEQIKHMLQEGF